MAEINSLNPLFSVRGLTKRFPNGFEALSGIDLDIFEGECLVVAGANGSGKTLLMRMLAGLLEPTEGRLLFRGKPLGECGKLLRQSAGLVFQDSDAQILGETVEEDIRFGPENLKLGEKEIKSRVEQALAALELTEKRDFSPRRLSGGEKRRLAVAGILAMGCQTVIMDEPFANMDWPGVVQVLNIITGLKQSAKTVIVLTHELEKVLAFADRLVILAGGKIRDQGESEAVLDRLEAAWGVRDPRRMYRSARDCTWL
ncbi:MAG: energy-coupling factor ABC transporter ATP-binding protein [Treponema sp.]|nr:energy-coupling factor ABC transporter ATP-binding protein [Treponema sp.]MCL2232817.1 energy-coupling factor ABC transporter ATP-binding protein [Treponema sp.]